MGQPGEPYKKLLRDLILQVIVPPQYWRSPLQGLLKLQEEKVTLRCREADQALVNAAIPDAINQYRAKTGNSANVTIDTNNWLAPAYSASNQTEFWYEIDASAKLLAYVRFQLGRRSSIGTRGPYHLLQHTRPAVVAGIRAAAARDQKDPVWQVRNS